ncbi:TPA: hypothetical protein RQN23_003009 [Aeromonas veronii]|nr:hypothetical protein [Aeromonas veronii]
MAKWVLEHAHLLSKEQLKDIKAQADSPVLNDETLFDELPPNVRALFVNEAYFPKRLFNSTFAWLFGAESIGGIGEAGIKHHRELVDSDPRYLLDDLHRLPLTQAEYEHVFYALFNNTTRSENHYIENCIRGLASHPHLTAEINKEASDAYIFYMHSDHISRELADSLYDEAYAQCMEFWDDMGMNPDAEKIVNDLRRNLSCTNLSDSKRYGLLEKFGYKKLSINDINNFFNGAIPDDVINGALSNGLINKKMSLDCSFILKDVRIPEPLAKDIAEGNPDYFASNYLRRTDLSAAHREWAVKKLIETTIHPYPADFAEASKRLASLIEDGLLTESEISGLVTNNNWFQFRSAAAKWISEKRPDVSSDFMKLLVSEGFVVTKLAEIHDNVDDLLTALKQRFWDGDQAKWGVMGFDWINNKNWTIGKLLELVALFREPEEHAIQVKNNAFRQMLANFSKGSDEFAIQIRKHAFRRILGEFIYPSVIEGVAIPHGETGKVIVSLLKDKQFIEEEDIKPLAMTVVNTESWDDEANLPAALVTHPGLNEEVVALRLQRRLNGIAEAPAPLETRTRRMM